MSIAGAWAQRLLPPAVFDAVQRARGQVVRFTGPYGDWPHAMRHARGYDDPAIVRKAAAATREVVAGRAAFERDSVTFAEPEMPLDLLGVLLRHVLLHPGGLEVIDFGGSLGSRYRQCRPYLPSLPTLRWHVVEQPSFVAAGRAEFTTDELDFHDAVSELPAPAVAPLLLASGSLCYLPDPAAQLDEWARSPATTLFIDRTPMSTRPDDVLSVQHAPEWIYRSSYPCWVFSRSLLLARLSPHWRLVGEHDCLLDGRHAVPGGCEFGFKGLLFERGPA